MNFKNKHPLTTKKFWYSVKELRPIHASLADIYGFKIKYGKKVKSELSFFYKESIKLNLNNDIVGQLAEWEEMYENCDDYEMFVIFRHQDLKYHIYPCVEYMENDKVKIKHLEREIEEYVSGESLGLVEIKEETYKYFREAQDEKNKKLQKILSNLDTEASIDESIQDETQSPIEVKIQKYKWLNDFINLAFNICILYMIGLLLLTMVHINSNPISNDLLKKSMEDEYSEIHKAARDYLVNNNTIRIQTDRILCLSSTEQFNSHLFDKSDFEACSYFKKGNTEDSLLKLDEIQASAYLNNRSSFMEFILISLHLLAIIFTFNWLFKEKDKPSK
ncbi:hypothetical protein V4100_000986 [Pseudomonas aeruginosa]